MKTQLFGIILAAIVAPIYAANDTPSTVPQPSEKNENATVAEKSVVIQTGAFNNNNFASGQAARVSLLGVPSKVVQLKDNKSNTTLHVVRSYRMSRKDAEEVVGRLHENDVPTMMIVY